MKIHCTAMHDGKPCKRSFMTQRGLTTHLALIGKKRGKNKVKKIKHITMLKEVPSIDHFIKLAKEKYKTQINASDKLQILSQCYRAIESIV